MTKISKNQKSTQSDRIAQYIMIGSAIWLVVWTYILIQFPVDTHVVVNLLQSLGLPTRGYLNDFVTIAPLLIGSFALSWGWNLKLARGYKWLFVSIIIGGILISVLFYIVWAIFQLQHNLTF